MNKNEITIPIEVFDGRFTLEEVASLCVFMAHPHLNIEIIEKWNQNDEFQSNIRKLIDNGTISFKKDGATINIDQKPKTDMHLEKPQQ